MQLICSRLAQFKVTKYITICVMLIGTLTLATCGNKSSQQTPNDQDATKQLTPLQRALHSTNHYWDSFNFNDTALNIDDPLLRQSFARWAESALFLYLNHDTIVTPQLVIQASVNDKILHTFMAIADDCFRDPNSAFRCEEVYIPMLQQVLKCDIDSTHRFRYNSLLETAMMNRQGTTASDFTYTTDNGSKSTLYNTHSPLLLLYFFNPDCHDCERVSSIIASDATIANSIRTRELIVLAVYPDEDLTAWKKHQGKNPKSWITARFSTPLERDKYDLPAIPNLYLLDSTKTVIAKDATIEEIISILANRYEATLGNQPY